MLIVTSEPTAEAIGHGYGATVIADDVEQGQSAAVLIGIEQALERGATRVLLVPGDCPALDPAEVDDLLASAAPGVVIVPDRHGSGTNALLLDPPTVLTPAFGPGSFARHAALSHAAGATVRVGRLPSLELTTAQVGSLTSTEIGALTRTIVP